jgi:hypothetical protein
MSKVMNQGVGIFRRTETKWLQDTLTPSWHVAKVGILERELLLREKGIDLRLLDLEDSFNLRS